MVAVSSRQVAPFQALLNMVKINYERNKPEIFRTVIAVLCDYDPTHLASLERTFRYIKILLKDSPDIAECLISFLPSAAPQPKEKPRTFADQSTQTFAKENKETQLVINPYVTPSKILRGPAVKESYQAGGHTTRPIDMGRPGPVEFSYGGNTSAFCPVVSPIRVSSHVINKPTSDTNVTSPRVSTVPPIMSPPRDFINMYQPQLIPAQRAALDLSHMKAATESSRIRPLFGKYDMQMNAITPTTSSRYIYSPSVNKDHMIYPGGDAYPQPLTYTFTGQGLATPAVQATPIQNNPILNPKQQISASATPLGITVSLPKLLNAGGKSLSATNPTLTHLLGMTKAPPNSPTGQLEPKPINQNTVTKKILKANIIEGKFHRNITDLTGLAKKIPKLNVIEGKLDSLKELTNKLKVAEKTFKGQQFANKIHPVLESPAPVNLSGMSFKLKENQTFTLGSNRNLTSFPYMHRIMLPDGDVRTLNIGSQGTATKMEVTQRAATTSGDGESEKKKKRLEDLGTKMTVGSSSVDAEKKKKKLEMKRMKSGKDVPQKKSDA